MADYFTDSPRASLYPLQPTESLLQPAPRSPDSLPLEQSDKSSALPESSIPPRPYHSIGNEQSVIPTSPLASSAWGLLAATPFPASPETRDHVLMSAEGSSQNSPHQRVPFESNHASASTSNYSPRTKVHVHPLLHETTPRNIDTALKRVARSSDPTRPTAAVRLAGTASSPRKLGHGSPPTSSAPNSRTSSPIRLFSWSGFHRNHDDPFVPVNPFRIRARLRRLSLYNSDIEHGTPFDSTCEESPFCRFPSLPRGSRDRFFSFLQDGRYFILDTLPRQTYLHLLFRLPSLYFSRIAKVYEDAQLSKPDIDRMIESYSGSRQQQQHERVVRSSPIPPGVHYHPAIVLPFPDEWSTANVSPALIRFKQSWEGFIDSLMREWKTLNLVSALLLSAIVSMFQTQVMANDPVIRTAALLSLTSALMSLSFGCIYIIRFGTMRSMYKATRWAEEAARTTTFILWNVWVLLAMPAVWLSWCVVYWSMIFFIVAILSFVWRYGSSTDLASPQPLSPTGALGPRIAISALFFLGLLYFAAIVKTLHNYGRTGEHKLFGRTAGGSGMPNTKEDDAQGERENKRGHGTNSGRDGGHGHDSARANRGRERTRRGHGRDTTEAGALSAVTGLGLRGLDDVASRSSDEASRDNQ